MVLIKVATDDIHQRITALAEGINTENKWLAQTVMLSKRLQEQKG